jgi:hypothetical protein
VRDEKRKLEYTRGLEKSILIGQSVAFKAGLVMTSGRILGSEQPRAETWCRRGIIWDLSSRVRIIPDPTSHSRESQAGQHVIDMLQQELFETTY